MSNVNWISAMLMGGTLGLAQLAGAQAAAPQPAGSPPTTVAAATPSEDSTADLAKKLSNPVASLISVPFQSNFDFGLGPNKDGFRYQLNFQPVLPFALNKDWNLLSRTIVPIVHQSNVIGNTSQSGLSDTVQSFFFSPTKTSPFIWGLGPVLLIPTATNHLLGTQKFGIGPTGAVLKQTNAWTYGVLFNHVWSVAGARNRSDVSATFLNPFVSYTTKTFWSFALQTESSYDWTASQWTAPVSVSASKLLRFGRQPVSVGGGLRCYAASPVGGPQNCGFRISVTPLFPKR